MSQIHDILVDRIGSPSCFCGSREGFTLKQKHMDGKWLVGLHCKTCGTQLKWVSEKKISKHEIVVKETRETDQLGHFT